MLTSLNAAKLCQSSYDREYAAWDRWLDINGVVAGIKHGSGSTIVAFRGSDCAEDWERDLELLPTRHGKLGFVHSGFVEGMDHFYDAVKPHLVGDLAFVGHSLGAARACLLAGMMDRRVVEIHLFGCPRPGFAKLRDLVRQNCDAVYSFRNRGDPVAEVPYMLGLYKHVVDPVRVDSRIETINPFDDHEIAQYVKALGG